MDAVMDRIAILFKDHTDLLQDFTLFLPDQVAASGRHDMDRAAAAARAQERQQAAAAGSGHGGGSGGGACSSLPSSASGAEGAPPTLPSAAAAAAPAATAAMAASGSDESAAFDYVAKVKSRFGPDSHHYKQFLLALREYQSQQKKIGEVLERVSELFADHPDLVHDFSFFLPISMTSPHAAASAP